MAGAVGVDEWVKRVEQAVLAARGSAKAPTAADEPSGVVTLVVSSGERRGRSEACLWWRYSSGQPVGGGVGKPATDVELELSAGLDDADAMLRGEVEPSVSFMRGRLKASGDGELLLAVLRSTSGEPFEVWRGRVAEGF